MNTVIRIYAAIAFLFAATNALMAQNVKLKSGNCYEIRCAEFSSGCVVPAPTDPLALTHSTTSEKKSAIWRITLLDNGFYSIQHAETNLYMTYDGQRTTTRRYMRLTEKMEGSASLWHIYPGDSHVIITNVQSQYLLNVRRGSHIVGLYNNTTDKATSNERFSLYDKKGNLVTSINNQEVVFKPVETTATQRNRAQSEKRHTASYTGILDFTINGKSPTYDGRTKSYLFSLSQQLIGENVKLKLACKTFPNAKVYVNGKPTSTNGTISLGTVQGAQTYRIAIAETSDTLARTTLQFTYMPIIEILSSGFSNSNWGTGKIVIHDAACSADSAYSIQVRNRGDFTSRYNKRSMGVKLSGTYGKKINRSLLGLRTDNYWILDAMTVDPSRMRGRVAMDLWNDFAEAPYFAKTVKGVQKSSRGRLVEVFLNGTYHGIYNLCERIDRKQLQIAKASESAPGGMLYKADQWSNATLFTSIHNNWYGSNSPSERAASWNSWQIKYPEPSNKRNANWQPLLEAIQAVSNTNDTDFCQHINTYFDLPAVRDYFLLIELLFATDNTGKNMYWAIQNYQKDRRLTPVPWDLDGTFGRNYSGTLKANHATENYRTYLKNATHQNTLFERLYQLNPNDWNAQIAQRYLKLRKSHFNIQQLAKRFDSYLQLMEQSGAHIREAQRWSDVNGIHINIPNEVLYIQQWLKQRLNFLDSQYQR